MHVLDEPTTVRGYTATKDQLLARLERRTAFELAVTDRHLYLTIRGETLDGTVDRHAILNAS